MRAPHVTAIRSSRLSIAVLAVLALVLPLLVLVAPSAEAARNKPPTLKPIGTKTVRVGQVLTVRPKASDRDRGPKKLRFSAKGRPSWLALSAKTGVLKGRAPAAAAGRSWRVTLRVSDGRAVRSRAFTVRVTNQAPRLAALSNRVATAGVPVSIRPSAVDPDRGPKALRYSVSYKPAAGSPSRPTWLALNAATGGLTGTAPQSAVGKRWTVTVTVTDGLAKATRSFTLQVVAPQPVNKAPVVAAQSLTIDENLAGGTVGQVVGSDPDGDDLTWSLITAGPFAMSATGKLITTEELNFEDKASYQLTVQASDGKSTTRATVTVAVGDVDESPEVGPIGNLTTDEDAAIDPIEVTATDPEGKDVTVTVTGLPTGLSYDEDDGTISGTPTGPGTATITVTADDGTSAATVVTFTIDVTPVNDAPVIADQSFTVAAGAPAGTAIGQLTATDEEDEADALTFTTASTDFAVSADGQLTVAAGGVPTGGPFTFDVTVEDEDGESTTASVTVTVGPDQPPVVQDGQSFSVPESSVTGTPVGTVQAQDPDGDSIAYDIVGGNVADAFTIDAATGQLTVAGGLDFETTGSYELTVRATAGAKNDEATVTIDVDDVNEAPTVAPIADRSATEDQAIDPIDVSVNDPDQGGSVTVTVAGLPAGLAYAAGKITGAPTVPGSFDVTITATDQGGLAGAASFTLTVNNVNDAPVIAAVADQAGTEGQAITPVAVTATDEDGDDVTFGVSALPAGLTWDAATATISGTPTQSGDFSITVTATDGNGGTDTETFLLSVTDVNDAPVIVSVTPATISGTVGVPVMTVLTVVVNDEDGDPVDFALTGLPSGLSALDNGDGTFTVSGTPTTAGSTTATITATDGDGASDTADLPVTIDAPVPACTPRSTLPCAQVPVGLPYSLSFNGSDGGLGNTGFTMVDPPSASRTSVDQAPAPTTPSVPAVPGYEPGLVSTTGGDLALAATKGIMYRRPADSAGTNSQLNALGVGIGGAGNGYEIETTLPAPTFFSSAGAATSSSQQGGVWFGLGEDDYVKAAVVRLTSTTNKVQLVSEAGGIATPATTYELNSAAFPAGQDVRLVLRAADTAGSGGTVSVQYSVNGGALTQLTDATNTVSSTTLPVAQNLFTGVALGAGTSSFAGLYATKRGAAASDSVVVKFADFAVRAIASAPELHEKYSFTTTADTAVPAGYSKNNGAAWTDASGIGWVTQASLAGATHAPLDLTTNTRVRTRPAPVTALQNRMIHMQYGDVDGGNGTSGNKTAGAFERAVPNGWYQVKVSVGDQMGATAYDSQHTVNVEGVVALNRFQATAAREYETATVTARVTDGRLTIDALGGTNTKLNYVEIDSTTAPVEPDVHAKVRFSDEPSAPPATYVKDFGEAYGARSGTDQGTGLTYGWSAIATKQPVSLVGNGRNRNTGASPAGVSELQAGLVHMQLPDNATGGVKTPAYWEMAVPNGTYTVSVSAGDAISVDTEAWLNIEGQNAIAEFVPTGANGAATHWASATRTVSVTDGRLTVSPEGGVNTKINWVTLDSVAGASERPAVLKCTPANLATAVSPTGGIVCDLSLIGGGVAPSTLAGAVKLVDVVDGTVVDGNVQTSGGSDTINFSPIAALDPNTIYRLEIGNGVKDVDGRTFLPYATAFTTGTTTGGGGPVAFDKVAAGAADGKSYTSVTVGPDGKLYASSVTGEIYRFAINGDGTLGTPQVITTVQDYSRQVGDTYNPGFRTVIGLTFDPSSTASNLILWITDNAPFLGSADVPDSSGRLAKLTGPNLGTYTSVLDGLPRSVKDHETNSIAFGPDGALYFTQGANNAMGAPDGAWGNRPERLLSAAVLRLDTSKLPATLPAKGVNVRTGDAGSYDPFAASAPLTIYARGTRNAYDLVWHSNGHLYVPTNGSAAGGNVPAVPADGSLPATCANRPDGTYVGRPKVAAQTSNPEETDYVFDVKKDRYYGHPNPTRCEYVLNNGNPTAAKDKFENSKYPVGTASDPNYDLAGVYDAGLHASANGAIEYKGGAFGGALNGKLLYLRYSSGSDIVSFDAAPDGTLSNQTFGLNGTTNMQAPLDMAEDLATGNLYVTEMTQDGAHSAIKLLKPQGGGGGPVATATDRLVFSGPTGSTSAVRNAVVKNTGIDDLVVTGASLGGDSAGQYAQPSSPSYPVTVASGATVSIPVTFKPTSTGIKAATLSVATSAGAKTVRLRGLAAAGLGGANEPSLQSIMDTLEIPINVGNATSSTGSMIGDEVPAQLFTKAKFDAPISIEPIAAYGPQDNDPAIKVGWYDAGNATGLHQQYTVSAADAQGLMINPTGTTDNIDPGEETAFGIYSEWPYFSGRKAYTEDKLNTWDPTRLHHLRVYPLKNADGTVEPNAYVVATEEVPGATFDLQDIVVVVRNVKPYLPAATSAVLKVANPDPAPFADQVAFSRIQTTADANQKVADTGTVRISNTGTEAMQVTGITLTDTFALEGGPTLPFTLAPGATQDVTVRFTATSTKVHNGTLTVQSNAGNGSQSIRLGGLWQSLSENNQEPSVVQIARAFGIGTNIPTDLNGNGHVEAVGDEILSPYWLRRNTAQPVTVRQLSGYHTYPNGATISRFDKGSTGKTTVTNMNNLWAQSLLPPRSGSTTLPALGTFTPGTAAFGFDVDNEKSDPALNSHTADVANGCAEPCGHHVRIFPVEDRDGVAVPGAYLLMMDYSGINYDYNDNTYLITNIRPEKLPTPQGVTTSAGNAKVTISWSPSTDPDVKYRVYRGTSAAVAVGGTGSAAAVEVTPTGSTGAISTTSFTDTGVTNGTTYYYIVRAVIPGTTNSDSTAAVPATPNAASAFAQKVNFQSAVAPVPAGYLRDYGQAFGARTSADQGSGLTYGWLTEAGRQPLDLSVGGTTNVGNGRDRDLETDQRLDTFMHMQAEDVPSFNGTAINGMWEMAVPNGQYAVTVAVGDGAANADPEVHRINVEGANAIAGFVPTGGAGSATHHATATVTVTVADGRLSVDAIGGTNTKLDYVDVAAVG